MDKKSLSGIRILLRIISLFFLLLLPFCSRAQHSVWDKQSLSAKASKSQSVFRHWKDHLQRWGTDTSYRHEFSVAGRLTSDGWSLGLIYGRKAEKKPSKLLFSLLFSEIRHDKQVKQERSNTAFPELGNSTPYVFGKINNLYTLQLGISRDQMLLPAVLDGNLSVGLRYGGGFSLALLKPYYLRLLHIDNSTQPPTATVQEERYSEANSELFLNPARILGAAHWEKGLSDVQYIPGAYGELAISIEAGKQTGLVKTITIGAQAALYSKELPIMAEQKAQRWNARWFVGLQLGKRWH